MEYALDSYAHTRKYTRRYTQGHVHACTRVQTQLKYTETLMLTDNHANKDIYIVTILYFL